MTGEATVDAYGDDEQALGFHAMIVDNLKISGGYAVAPPFVERGLRRGCLPGILAARRLGIGFRGVNIVRPRAARWGR
jgi:hypothetical protein